MAVTAGPFRLAVTSLFNAEIDYLDQPIKAMLLDNTFTLDHTTQRYISHVNGDEVSGTGYTAGGLALTNKTLTWDGTAGAVELAADNLQWTGTTLTAVRWMVLYQDTTVTTTSPLISWMNFGADQATSNQPFLVTVPAGGLVSIAIA